MRFCPLLLGSLLLVACGSSHGRTDGSAGPDAGDSSCTGPQPSDCWRITREGCCTPAPATCAADGTWRCGDRITCGPICEPRPGCAGAPPSCHRSLGGGCCGEAATTASCTGSVWECPSMLVTRSECLAFPPACSASGCDAHTESACVADPGCVPIYDDFCCPACAPEMGCADCAQMQMFRCAPADEACGAMMCGTTSMLHCAQEVADCTGASPTQDGRCNREGCVAATPVACSDCMATCVPVTAGTCSAVCAQAPPACPDGLVAEADGACWTGRCVAASACSPAQAPGP